MYFFSFVFLLLATYTHILWLIFKCCTVLLDFFLLYLSSTITLFIQFLLFSRSSDPNAYLAHQSTKAQKHHFNLFLRLNFQKSFFTAYRYHHQNMHPNIWTFWNFNPIKTERNVLSTNNDFKFFQSSSFVLNTYCPSTLIYLLTFRIFIEISILFPFTNWPSIFQYIFFPAFHCLDFIYTMIFSPFSQFLNTIE